MPFCTSCGADVTNKSFCELCGTPAGGVRPAAPSPTPAAAGVAAPAAAKGVHPIVWILVGIFGLFVLGGIVLTVGAGLLVHKVKQNPALAMAKLLTAANPDVSVVSSDAGNNTVTFRDKKTGETITMDFDEIKKGKIIFKGDRGQEATIQAHADGQSGAVEINSPQGTMKFGAGAGAAKMPDWVPAYPGVAAQATFSIQGADGNGGSFQFTTKDAAKDVLAFYEENLKKAGFEITANVTGAAGGSSGGVLSAEDKGTNRTVMVTLGSENGATTVHVLFGTKKP
jgi:hypothetical protein